MCQNLLTPPVAQDLRQAERRTPRLRGEAEEVLREAAYVLALTRRVRSEIVGEEEPVDLR